jgi:hypothetical protein
MISLLASCPSVEEVVVVVLVIMAASLATLPAWGRVASWVLGLHLDIAVCQSVEQQIGSELLVFIAGEVGLG